MSAQVCSVVVSIEERAGIASDVPKIDGAAVVSLSLRFNQPFPGMNLFLDL